jgi:hypothetical protein
MAVSGISALPPGWRTLNRVESEKLTPALSRQICSGHILFDRGVISIARDDRSDDVLFHDAAAAQYFWVHLTWRVETDPSVPQATPFKTVADFATAWGKDRLPVDTGDLQ